MLISEILTHFRIIPELPERKPRQTKFYQYTHNKRIIPSMTFVPNFLSKILKHKVSRRETIVGLDLPSKTDIFDGEIPHFIKRDV